MLRLSLATFAMTAALSSAVQIDASLDASLDASVGAWDCSKQSDGTYIDPSGRVHYDYMSCWFDLLSLLGTY